MKYAIVVWMSESEKLMETGTIYGWYESLATVINTCIDLRRDKRYWDAQAVKLV